MSFGNIRSLLQRAPDPKRWARLCAMLDSVDPRQFDDMVQPYVLGQARRWPEALCIAPHDWVLRTLHGEDLPFWGIARHIDLSCNYLDPKELKRLLESDRLDNVTILNLDSNRIGDRGAKTLASAKFTRLRVLKLGFNDIGNRGFRFLHRAPYLHALEELRLERCSLSGSALEAMAEAPWLPGLQVLDLKNNAFEPGALARFLGEAPLRDLRVLVLDRNPFNAACAEALASRTDLHQLEALELRHCAVSDAALAALASAPALRTVCLLDLARNAFGAAGVAALAASPTLHAPEKLYLIGNTVDAPAWRALLHAAWFRRLRRVSPPSPEAGEEHACHEIERSADLPETVEFIYYA